MLPVMRDPDGYILLQEEVGGTRDGGFEPKAKPWKVTVRAIPFQCSIDWDSSSRLIDQRDPSHPVPGDSEDQRCS